MISLLPCAARYSSCCYSPSSRLNRLEARRPNPLQHRKHRCQQISANKGKSRRASNVACSSAASVTERYEEAEANNPIKPLRHPFASWRQWWYIGKHSSAQPHKTQIMYYCASWRSSALCCRCNATVRAAKVSEIQQNMRKTMGNHEAQQNISVFCRDIHGQ